MTFNTIKSELFPKNNSFHFNFICFLFLLIPVTLITGPALPDIFLTIIGIYFLLISFMKKKFHYYQNNFTYLFSLFCLYIIIRGIFSEDPYSQLIDYNAPLFYFRYLFFVLGAWYLLDNNKILIKYFFYILFGVIIFTIFDGFIQWIFGKNLFGFTPTADRIPGIFNDEEILGKFLAFVVPLAFGLMIYLKKITKKRIILFMFFLIICEVFIFITHDRAALLRIVQFTILLIFLSNHFKLFRIISFCVSILLISIIIYSSPKSQLRYSNTITEVSSTKIPYMPWTPVHEKHFGLAYSFFEENPFFGKGPQYFKVLCIENPKLDGCIAHPHNFYFQTLGELGLIGISFLILGFCYILIILLKQFHHVWFKKNLRTNLPDHLIALYSLVFIFLWPVIPNVSFYNNHFNVMMYLTIPFLIYFRSLSRNS